VIQRLSLKRLLPKLAKWRLLDWVPVSYRVASAGVALVGLLVFNMLIALQSAQNVFDGQETLQRGLASQQLISSMSSHAKDIETGVRGYFITGDPQFLEPYERGRQALQKQLELIDVGLFKDPSSAVLLDNFRHELTAVLDQSQSFVRMRQEMRGRANVDRLAPLVERQRERMDALRDSTVSLIANRRAANDVSEAASIKARQSARVSILVPSFISILLAAFLCYLVIRDLRQRRVLELQSKRLLEQERQARAEAEAASQAKDEFVSMVTHELRTPLQAILGWAQFLTRLVRGRDTAPAAQIGTQLQTIERNARSLARMIDDLLDVSRTISGKLTLVTRRIDLVDILHAAMEVARPAASGKGLELTLELHDAPLWMVGDADRLRQVAINLVGNAVKFTPTGGSIQVGARRDGTRLEIKVRDSGIGIAPELLPRIFERYVQGSVSSARQYGGLGLGLAIVKHLVEMHGGQVSVSSAGSGCGAEFTVRFPIHALLPSAAEPPQLAAGSLPEAEPGPGRSARSSGPRLSGLCLLVVDDDADVRLVLESLLLDEGARVVLASSAAEAMERLRAERMDLILSDVGMPETDGYDLARGIRGLVETGSTTPSAVPLIALTAFSRAEDERRALDSGFNLHLAKPVDMEKLITMIAEHAAVPAAAPMKISATAPIETVMEMPIAALPVQGLDAE
jgi:signal transduction histidine kinase/FixJ family two-component response regulator